MLLQDPVENAAGAKVGKTQLRSRIPTSTQTGRQAD